MKQKIKKLSSNYMDIVFVRSESFPWREKEGSEGQTGTFVEIDMENRGFFNWIAQKLFKRPRISHISLDKYGTKLWLALDGKATVNDVLLKMKNTFPEESEKMLNRVVHFLATLEAHRFIIRN